MRFTLEFNDVSLVDVVQLHCRQLARTCLTVARRSDLHAGAGAYVIRWQVHEQHGPRAAT